ncbi:bifunctional adenosylcobinamide kinase/adenosylcobinamide-phosphate guanylyltransferase [uncultured Sphingomonas sp.]|uniref:bifunctional adenosylcobinamide kinase/adenosylcobinamide-phosphate guanylyltransferase n=1 Tax=uncultured Sphingomonas sp. TaxID=158754 RepID=UPI0035CAAF8B
MAEQDASMTGHTTLFLGGARSGKSRLAQAAAEALPGSLTYLATAEAGDDEMADRIARHRADRGERWRTVECPIDLPRAIGDAIGDADGVVLVDCLTLWLSNLMLGGHDIEAAGAALIAAMADARGPLLLVSNEVGLGLVPETPLGRAFRDAAGRLNQAVAAAATRVVFVAAGLPLTLK